VCVLDGASNDTIRSIQTDYGSWDLCLNPVQNRVYVANRDNPTISVIRDSVSGVEEPPSADVRTTKSEAEVVQSLSEGAVVFDAMGRRAVNPKPGVYFVRDEGRGAGGGGRTRKVIVSE